MNEPYTLRQRRLKLLDQIGQAADEIKQIDNRLTVLRNQDQ